MHNYIECIGNIPLLDYNFFLTITFIMKYRYHFPYVVENIYGAEEIALFEGLDQILDILVCTLFEWFYYY